MGKCACGIGLADMRMWARNLGISQWRSRLVRIAIDALLIAGAMALAFCLRFEGAVPGQMVPILWRTIVLAVGIKISVLFAFRAYQISWRHVGLGDLVTTGAACIVGTAVLTAFVYLIRDVPLWSAVPRSILGIDFALCLLAISGVRLSRRMFVHTLTRTRSQGRRALVVGAGDAAAELLRILESDSSYAVIGILDDDPAKAGLRVRGIAVLGGCELMTQIVRRHRIASILIAMPSAPPEALRKTVEAARETGIQDVKIIPQLSELYTGIGSTSVLREVRPEDVLRRDPVHVDSQSVSSYIAGRTALVTGAAGSIGTELCRQLLGFGAECLIALDFNETGLFYLKADLSQRFPDRDVRVVVADVRDADQIERILWAEKPYAVYHAAAYKHVPMMEAFPCEAVKTNVGGTRNVLHAARSSGADAFVLISTDKAVNPTSVMGTTKRIAELLVRDQQSEATRCMTVRFGNVLGSRGSVLKTFQDQVEARQPITVTHPDMTRFFMVTSEAVQLVLQAGVIGESGQVLVLEMGTPVKIVDLAKDVIRFYGLEPDEDLPIVFSGTRPGEKLYEELFTVEEGAEATSHKRILSARMEKPAQDWLALLSQLTAVADAGDDAAVMQQLRELVPEFKNGGGQGEAVQS
ncbi:SDR family NAD(P)-dependent oxidoreductase [Candidatus Bipolaricaulota bacterium]